LFLSVILALAFGMTHAPIVFACSNARLQSNSSATAFAHDDVSQLHGFKGFAGNRPSFEVVRPG